METLLFTSLSLFLILSFLSPISTINSGSSWLNSNYNGNFNNNGNSETKQCGCGVEGPRGPRGAPGPQGPPGNQGPEGAGAAGSTLAVGVYPIQQQSLTHVQISHTNSGLQVALSSPIIISFIFDSELHVLASFHVHDYNLGNGSFCAAGPASNCEWLDSQTLLFNFGILRIASGEANQIYGYDIDFTTHGQNLDGNYRIVNVQFVDHAAALTTVEYLPVVTMYAVPEFNSLDGILQVEGKVLISTYGEFVGTTQS